MQTCGCLKCVVMCRSPTHNYTDGIVAQLATVELVLNVGMVATICKFYTSTTTMCVVERTATAANLCNRYGCKVARRANIPNRWVAKHMYHSTTHISVGVCVRRQIRNKCTAIQERLVHYTGAAGDCGHATVKQQRQPPPPPPPPLPPPSPHCNIRREMWLPNSRMLRQH